MSRASERDTGNQFHPQPERHTGSERLKKPSQIKP
jgi:hypothetical protein